VFSYAHWEGFVKDAAQAYIAFAMYPAPALRALTACFQALVSRSVLLEAAAAKKKIGHHLEVVKRFTDRIDEAVRLDPGKAIDTESNLQWEVFANICDSIGVDLARWSAYGPFMNEMFVQRCAIAHGSLVPVPDEYANETLTKALEFIDWFKADVTNAATRNRHLRS
jgi:hypothetical protein